MRTPRTDIAASVLAQMQPFAPVAPPVDVTDAEQFPEIARAIAGLAAMSPERRAQILKEWNDG